MKKYIISAVVVVAFGVYVLLNYQSSITVPAPVTATAGSGTNTTASPIAQNEPSSTAAGSPNLPGQTAPAGAPAAGAYKDGSYSGSVANAYFGNLQVEVVIAGGKLTDVQVPVYPNDSGHSQEVSNQSLPLLKQEAIQAQNANVNIVSGATQTSEAFQQSLAAALAVAKN